jgi:CBS domain containing-hemolysin-like protein
LLTIREKLEGLSFPWEIEMDPLTLAKLVGIVLLITGNAFFVGSEIALTPARRSRIRHLAEQGNKKAGVVQVLHAEPERFYSVTQIGITLMSLALGAIGISTFTTILKPSITFVVGHLSIFVPPARTHTVAITTAHIIAFLFISALHVVGGELAPKVYAFHRPVRSSLAVARTVNLLYRLLYPAIWLLNHASNGLLRLFGQRDLVGPKGGHLSISEEELRTILAASASEGILDSAETAMIQGVFDLDAHTVREVMVPRTKVVGLSKGMTIRAFLKIFRQERHHRYPVYDSNMDNIVGVLTIKELLKSFDPEAGAEEIERSISEIMLPPYLVPESKPLSTLLAEFKTKRQQMAIVIDEYGGTAGLVTLEDILEEIVGEYEDEFSPSPGFIKTKGKDGKTLIDPGIRLDDLGKMIECSFPEGEYNTLAGFIYHHLGRVPELGDSIKLPKCKIAVERMDGHRITLVSLEGPILEKDTEPGESKVTRKTPESP